MSEAGAVTISPAAPGDALDIGELYLASRADALPFLRRVHSDQETRDWVREVMLTRGRTWVARHGDQMIGFLNLVGDHLDQLYLAPGWYRRGVGTRLLAMAKAASPHGLELYAFQKNLRARAFYEHHGFIAARFGDGSENEEAEPDVLYVWRPADLAAEG